MLSIGFAMGEISSVWSPLSSSTAEPHSFLELSSVLPVRWSWKRFFIDGGLWFSSLPDWGQTRASKTLYSRVWIRQICAPPSSLVRVHPTLVLQISITTGWELHVKNSFGQDPLLIIARSFTLLITVRFQVDGPYTTSPLVPIGGYQCSSSSRVTPNAGGGLVVTWGSLFHWGNQRLKGHFSEWCCPGLGEGQSSQCVVNSLSLQCSLSWTLRYREVFQSQPLILGFSQQCLIFE